MALNRIIELSIGPKGSIGTLISQNRITFTAKKTDAKSENTCEVDVYNLAESTITSIARKDYFVSLRAGYEDESSVSNVFFGDVTGVSVEKEGTEKILSLSLTDGFSSLKDKPVSLTFAPGTLAIVIVNALITIIGLPLVTPINLEKSYVTGYAFSGRAQDALTEILGYAGLVWTISNNSIFIYDPQLPTPTTGITYSISQDTGLIGYPEMLSESETTFFPSLYPYNVKYRIKTILIPQIIPGSLIVLNSLKVKGSYIAESVTYRGDNWDGDFTNTMDIKEAI